MPPPNRRPDRPRPRLDQRPRRAPPARALRLRGRPAGLGQPGSGRPGAGHRAGHRGPPPRPAGPRRPGRGRLPAADGATGTRRRSAGQGLPTGATEVGVSLPPRRYDLAARLLADAIERARRSGDPIDETIVGVARDEGHASAWPPGAARSALEGPRPPADFVHHELRRTGFEPDILDDGVTVLRNCPFHQLAEQHIRSHLQHEPVPRGRAPRPGRGDGLGDPARTPRPVLLRATAPGGVIPGG